MERMKKNIVTYQKWFNNGKKWCELEVIISRKLFFFSSRRRHTRWNCDWSSDVCSSDLERRAAAAPFASGAAERLRQRSTGRATPKPPRRPHAPPTRRIQREASALFRAAGPLRRQG